MVAFVRFGLVVRRGTDAALLNEGGKKKDKVFHGNRRIKSQSIHAGRRLGSLFTIEPEPLLSPRLLQLASSSAAQRG